MSKTAYERATLQNAAIFYGAMDSDLGFGNLWMSIEHDAIQLYWRPDQSCRITAHVLLMAIDQARSIEALAIVESERMRQKYREAVENRPPFG